MALQCFCRVFLQCFCPATAWVRCNHMLIPPSWASLLLTPHPPPRSSRRWAEVHVPCSSFYTWPCVSVSPTLNSSAPLSPSSPRVHKSFLCILYLYSCPANSFISTLFLDSIFMWFIYMCIKIQYLFFSDFTLYNRLYINCTVSSTSLQMTQFYSLLWLSNDALCMNVFTRSSSSLRLSLDGWVSSMSWLL